MKARKIVLRRDRKNCLYFKNDIHPFNYIHPFCVLINKESIEYNYYKNKNNKNFLDIV